MMICQEVHFIYRHTHSLYAYFIVITQKDPVKEGYLIPSYVNKYIPKKSQNWYQLNEEWGLETYINEYPILDRCKSDE